jgi:signal transduction histidine kinase
MTRLMPLSFRAQLTLVLVAFSLVLTAALGWVAYRTSQGIIEREAIRAVGIAANAREQALLRLLHRQVDRADNFLRIARLSCLSENPKRDPCLRGLLEDFKMTEGATEARLEFRNEINLPVGADASVFSEMPSGDQLAKFITDDQGHSSYLLRIESENREASVSLLFPIKTITQIFSDRYGLGESGETFLTDARGYFITPSRDSAHSSGQSHPIESTPMKSCLSGHNGEMLERDYREIEVIHGFRYVKEIGGGCIMAHLDQSEAFAPAQTLRTEVTAMSAMFAAFAMVLSFALARSLAQPIVRLTARARALQAGDFTSPVAMDGPLEVRTFAGAFASMAQSLNESRTALLKSEQQHRRFNEELERMVAERTRELEAANREYAKQAEKLARSNADLERFAYIASHDLKEPLRMVMSFTKLLAKRYKDQLDADAEQFIGFAVDGAERMEQLIQDLLTYSRVSAPDKQFQPVDCQAAFTLALINLKTAIEESGAIVTCSALPVVLGDHTQLAQLFQNLIGNAVKYRSATPPTVHVSATRPSMPDDSEEWLFSVRDNGIGIDPQYADRIFVIFQRLHGREQYPGTGVGLAICKKIVERHGGRIWVESQLGQGATFYFTLPGNLSG